MRVSLERSGGFANQPFRLELDSEQLTPALAQTLRELVDRAHFFDQPAEIRANQGADRFQYDLTVEDGERQHSVRLDDGAGPEALLDLVDWLMDQESDPDAN
jgi:emfourin